ncbi:enoyl-CoA hydratase-related protein [Saprospiraceae bacterium]|nr:enoyl-CoA hydratase-related protein [Saprospiraceae bacterium]
MAFETLLIDIEDQIAIVTVNRPKALNAINDKVMTELNEVFTSHLNPKELKGVIITGSGEKAFVAGADISELSKKTGDEGYTVSKKGHDTYNAIESFSVPVLAAINGFSLGGGNELAMSCHIRIASVNARFGQPEVNLGLIPGYGGTQRLIQYIGKGRAMELLLTGDMIDVEKALEYGLITHVTTPENLLDTAKKIITKISQKGPEAVARTIDMVNAYFDKTSNGFVKEIDGFKKSIASDESTEGVAAFLEKRKPNFRG